MAVPTPELSAIRQHGEPEIKVILVKQALDEFQGMIDKGWKIASVFPHASGALFIMQRAPADIRLGK